MGRLLSSPLMTPHYSFCFVLLLFYYSPDIAHGFLAFVLDYLWIKKEKERAWLQPGHGRISREIYFQWSDVWMANYCVGRCEYPVLGHGLDVEKSGGFKA